MKKFISVALAIIMMFSISVIAFAASGSRIELEKEYKVTLKNDTVEYKFSVPDNGAYRISASISTSKNGIGSASLSVRFEEQSISTVNLLSVGNKDYEDLNEFINSDDSDIFIAKKGADYTVNIVIGLPYCEDEDIEYSKSTVTFKISKEDNLREIKIGESYTVSNDEFFLFKPTADGFCDIWSHECVELSIMDPDGNIIYGSIDLNGFPADIPFEYKAGEIYGIYAENGFDENGNAVDSVFHVVDATTVNPDIIDLEDITVIRGESEIVNPTVYPLGAIFNCNALECTIENEKIATIEYDSEYNELIIYGKRPGKTTLTVTEPNSGITREVEIEVITKITAFFRTVYEFISNIFNFVFGR